MHIYTKPGKARNTLKPSSVNAQREPALTRGGSVIKRRRPYWSASLCNTVAGLAGFSQEASHVG